MLESTCRELRRSKTFVPSIAELLKELKAQAERWGEALYVQDEDIEHWERERARIVAAAEAKAASA